MRAAALFIQKARDLDIGRIRVGSGQGRVDSKIKISSGHQSEKEETERTQTFVFTPLIESSLHVVTPTAL